MDHRRNTSSLYRKGELDIDTLVATSPSMRECLRQARQVAGTDLTVLVTGESGTGKTLLAQAIHNASARKDKPCIVISLSPSPPTTSPPPREAT